MQMAVSVKIQKFCYHGIKLDVTLLLSFEKSRFIENYAKYTAECLKTYTKMNGVLTLFVLAESTQVKWYKCLRLWL